MITLTTRLIDRTNNRTYHKQTITYETLEEALKYVETLQPKMCMYFTYVKYEIVVK